MRLLLGSMDVPLSVGSIFLVNMATFGEPASFSNLQKGYFAG
ncbi:hypothetical protein [Bradyrhizobium sp. McL0616]